MDLSAKTSTKGQVTSTPCGYATRETSHIFFLNSSNCHLTELYYDRKGWHVIDLSLRTYSPMISGMFGL